MKNSVLKKVALTGAVAVVGLGGGSAVAAAAGGTTAATPTYRACLSQARALYNVEVAASRAPSCRKGDKAISWNQSGPQGPQGPKGQKGDTGARR